MKPSRSQESSVKWYQLPPVEALNLLLNLGWRLALAAGAAGGRGLVACRKKPVAAALIVVVPLLVVAAHYAGRATGRRPAHLAKVIEELAAIKIPTGKPVPNHAGTKLGYVKFNTNDYWGIYVHDLTTGESRLVNQFGFGRTEENISGSAARILGWSPDDQFFAYGSKKTGDISIFDAKAHTHVGKFALKRPLTAWTWLSQNRFLYSDGTRIMEASSSRPKWVESLFYQTPKNVISTNAATGKGQKPRREISQLAAFWGSSVVWLQSNALHVGEQGLAPKRIWQATNTGLLDFDFSLEARKFLLHGRDAEGEFLVDFYPQALGGRDVLTNQVRLDTQYYRPEDVMLINNGNGYAYLNQSDFSLNQLIVKLTPASPPVKLPWVNEVRDFSINNQQLYAISSSTNEPGGVWRYDLVTGKLDCLVSSLDRPFQYAANARVQEGYVTNAAGERLTYYLLHPTGPPRQQKRPLVVCIMGLGGGVKGYSWDRYAQTIANCGAYFVSMDRRKRAFGQWADDALCAYEFLAKKPEIDTNRVYLLGVSGGNAGVNQLLTTRPELWRGAAYYGEPRFPNPAQLRAKSIQLDLGAEEVAAGESRSRLLQTQDELAAAGIQPVLMIHPGVGHIVRTLALERGRLTQLAEFICEP